MQRTIIKRRAQGIRAKGGSNGEEKQRNYLAMLPMRTVKPQSETNSSGIRNLSSCCGSGFNRKYWEEYP